MINNDVDEIKIPHIFFYYLPIACKMKGGSDMFNDLFIAVVKMSLNWRRRSEKR